jgi:NTE family protein
MEKTKPAYGLALEGGGAKGAFHMGAYKALDELGIDIGAVAGTSIGALNGAIIAQGEFETGYEWWEQMDTAMLFDIEKTNIEKHIGKKVSKNMLAVWTKLAKDIIGNRGLDTKKIRDILEKVIDEEKIRSSGMQLGIVTVSVTDWKPVEIFKDDIPQGKLIDYLMASANLPVFKLEPLDGKYYLDGGFYDNCPVNLLGRRGIKDIIAIRTFGIGRIRKVDDDINVINIFPSKDLGKILIFDNDTIKENLKMGYFDAMKSFKNLKGSNYYIEPAKDDGEILKKLLTLPDEELDGLAKDMGYAGQPSQRLLLEKMLPELAVLTGHKNGYAYQDIVIGVLENAAQAVGIDRYKIYSLSSFVKEIKKTIPETELYRTETMHTIAARKQHKSAVLLRTASVILNNMEL